ncbi:MAG: hypothetical protein PG981_000529 [Wolbachia endosymbiont of Ctenocephalides orientis wCori]|nr:MAG: hypothetical protein PG981_000529 [Wolbachia endosymbiont of Ctenocephalides orientis wCori]
MEVNQSTQELNKQFTYACQRGDLEQVKNYIQQGANVDFIDNRGHTPLWHTARLSLGKCAEVARTLIEAGANVNFKDDDLFSPLHLATTRVPGIEIKVELVKVLIEAGADVNAKNNYGWTPLICTEFFSKNKEEVMPLLKAQLQKDQLLFDAIKTSDASKVQQSINDEANVNSTDDNGYTPLDLTIKTSNKQDIAEILIKNNANIKDSNGMAYLNWADQGAHTKDMVEFLVNNRANIEARDGNGRTPLHLSALHKDKQKEVLKFLIEEGANAKVEDNDGNTPLHLVIKDGNIENIVEVVRDLIDAGCDLNFTNKNCKTPLDIAVYRGNIEQAKLLEDHLLVAEIQDQVT